MNIGNLYISFQRTRIFLKVTVLIILMVEGRKVIFLFMKSCCHSSIKLKIQNENRYFKSPVGLPPWSSLTDWLYQLCRIWSDTNKRTLLLIVLGVNLTNVVTSVCSTLQECSVSVMWLCMFGTWLLCSRKICGYHKAGSEWSRLHWASNREIMSFVQVWHWGLFSPSLLKCPWIFQRTCS